MVRTQYYTATSLDGFIADDRNSLDWLLQFGDGSGQQYERFIAEVGALVMGATTYQWLLDNHIYADPDEVKSWPYVQPSLVFTHRHLRMVDGADIRFVQGDVAPIQAELTAVAAGKNIWVVGGGELAGQFFDAGLLDDIMLGIAPVSLGGGAPVLPRRIATPPLKLVSAEVDGSFVNVHYEVVRD